MVDKIFTVIDTELYNYGRLTSINYVMKSKGKDGRFEGILGRQFQFRNARGYIFFGGTAGGYDSETLYSVVFILKEQEIHFT